jgi:hypothetical protein
MEEQKSSSGAGSVKPNPTDSGNKGPSKDFMKTLEYYFVTKAPFQIPNNIKEMIVTFGPWINVIFLITFLPLMLALLGLSALFSIATLSFHAWTLSSIISIVTFVLGIIALPGLFKRKLSGWNMTFYEIIVSFVGSIISGNLVGGIVSVIIGLYIWFQVKSYYK